MKYLKTSLLVLFLFWGLGSYCQFQIPEKPKKETRLKTNKGTNIRKPTEAANPIPKKILKSVSNVIIAIYSIKKSSLKPIRYNFSLARVTAV